MTGGLIPYIAALIATIAVGIMNPSIPTATQAVVVQAKK